MCDWHCLVALHWSELAVAEELLLFVFGSISTMP